MNSFYKSVDVKKISNNVVQISRSFSAPCDLVYKAFTTPALLKRWMLGPPGWDMPVCEMDLREGGQYNWRWKNKSDNSEFGFFGVYQKVSSPQCIVNTQTFDPGTMGGDMGAECLITVTFSENNGITTVTTEMKFKTPEDMEKAVSTGMSQGMEMGYQRLDKILQT